MQGEIQDVPVNWAFWGSEMLVYFVIFPKGLRYFLSRKQVVVLKPRHRAIWCHGAGNRCLGHSSGLGQERGPTRSRCFNNMTKCCR